MTNVILRKVKYNFSAIAQGELLLPDESNLEFSRSNGESWLVVNEHLKKLNPEVNFDYLAHDIKYHGICKDNIFLEFDGKKIEYNATLIREPLKAKSDNWQETAHKWAVIINGVEFDYHTGLAHRKINKHKYRQHIDYDAIKMPSIYTFLNKNSLSDILMVSDAEKPKIDDVLNCLISDYYCGRNTFPDFCAELSYDVDSRKALETYLDCQKNGEKLFKTGLNIARLQEAFQDY